MKNNTIAIMMKEIKRIVSDKKLLFSVVLLPGIMIFAIYTFIGNFMVDMFTVDEDYTYQIHVVDMPSSIAPLFNDPDVRVNVIPATLAQIDDIKYDIQYQNTDVLVIFPPNFDQLVAEFDPATAIFPAPIVEIWSNMARTESAEGRHVVSAIIHGYHHSLTHRFHVIESDLATEADIFAMVLGVMIPMMFLMMLFSGCQALAPDSIAGEKERGSLGSMLVTPTRRRDIALGKVLSIAIFSLLSGIGSIIGVSLSMPAMMGMEGHLLMHYDVVDILWILVVVMSTTLVFVGLLSVLSAYAKSVKEANSYAGPVSFIVIAFGFSSMFLGGLANEVYFHFIPILNSALSIGAIVSFEVSVTNMVVTVGTNVVVAFIFVFVLTKIFNSEKIVFDK